MENQSNKDAISGTPAWEEDWSLDMTGNWTDYVQKTPGSTDLDQDRTHDEANEITDIDSSSTHVAHDKAGNLSDFLDVLIIPSISASQLDAGRTPGSLPEDWRRKGP